MTLRETRSRLQRTFKLDIVLLFSSLIVCTMLLITSFTYVQNRKVTLDLANRIMADAARSVIDRTIDYLRPAQTLSRLGAEFMSDPGAEALPGSGLERFFMRAMEAYPQIGLIYFADQDGNFFQVRRAVPEGTLTTRHIDRRGADPVETLLHRDDSGDVARRTESRDVSYDPRARPWFKGAVSAAATFWTDVYIFSTGNVPGITAASPAVDPGDGSLRGVLAADLTLDQLSAFLGELAVSERGLAFIMDDRGRIVAFPGAPAVGNDGSGGVQPLLAREVENPMVTAAVRGHEDQPRELFGFEFDGEAALAFVKPFPPSFGKPWNTVVLVPVDDFLGPIKRNSMITLGLSLVVLLLAIYLGLRFSRNIARPVEQLTHELNEIRDFHLGGRTEVKSYIREIRMMETAINSMKNGLSAFRRYVPADLVRDLIASGEEVEPGGKERELTILFSDIGNFTAISEEMTARELMVCLSEYFDVLTAAVAAEGGTVDKYIGDSLMAFWGAPRPDEDHARHCCRAVLRAIAALEDFNTAREADGKMGFRTRFGITTGFSIVGNVGSRDRLNYTALGDNVNLASRLEQVNKHYGTEVLISHNTYRYVRDSFVCRPVDLIAVRGRSTGVKIYELLAERTPDLPEALSCRAEMFRNGFDLYLRREWERALEVFEALGRSTPGDRPAGILAERCKTYLAAPPGEDWSGIWRIET